MSCIDWLELTHMMLAIDVCVEALYEYYTCAIPLINFVVQFLRTIKVLAISQLLVLCKNVHPGTLCLLGACTYGTWSFVQLCSSQVNYGSVDSQTIIATALPASPLM